MGDLENDVVVDEVVSLDELEGSEQVEDSTDEVLNAELAEEVELEEDAEDEDAEDSVEDEADDELI